MKAIKQEIEIGGRSLVLEYGRFAEQATSSIVARYGDTMVLVTVVASSPRDDLDYFPLTVDYLKKLYAGGKIKGSRWVKREGRPSDDEILTARLIDRSIRPLFPQSYKREVQVVATVLSVDLENDPAVLSLVATSAALACSSIPWNGPVGALRIGLRENTYFANPAGAELEFSNLDLILAADKETIYMIEAGAEEIPEDKILGAVEFGQKEAQKIVDGIVTLAGKVNTEKEKVVDTEDKELASFIDKKFGKQIEDFAKSGSNKESGNLSELISAVATSVDEDKKKQVAASVDYVMKKRVREMTLSGSRLDGRKHTDVRPISAEVGLLPRTHGSAFFKRGQTHVLTTTTLGAPRLAQTIESAEGEETKRYIHHYSMPPYTTGETGRIGYPSRREIGHGALAERALLPVIPAEKDFPYTVQVVSEVMSSNGSTSMGSTCASTLSLMDAGVPIKSPVSGIAMGLMIEDKKVAILSDIAGMEDFNGDMDFKVAGTANGVTAIQLDVKTSSLTLPILVQALNQSKVGRLHILDEMIKVLSEPRQTVSQHAPRVVRIEIPKEKIGEVIGGGGATIKRIMAETDVNIDIEDDGSVTIAGISQESVDRARELVEGIVKEVEPGEIYEGVVKRLQPFGAFVEISPGKDGLVHVSDMGKDGEFVKDPADVVSIDDKVTVRVKEVDNLGRINLSMRLDPSKDKPRERREDRPRREFSERRRDETRRPQRRFGRDTRGERGSSGGPHFAPSRFMPKKKF